MAGDLADHEIGDGSCVLSNDDNAVRIGMPAMGASCRPRRRSHLAAAHLAVGQPLPPASMATGCQAFHVANRDS